MFAWAPLDALAFDTDGDGADDSADAFPCDPQTAAEVFAPGQGEHALLMFEDQWPFASDYDFNDVVVSYNFQFRLDALGRTTTIIATINPLALGGRLHTGLALHLPVPASSVAQASVTLGLEGMPSTAVLSSADAEATFTILSDLRAAFHVASRIDPDNPINSSSTIIRFLPDPIQVEVRLSHPEYIDPAQAPFDMFIMRTSQPQHEIHLPEYPGTASMRTELFGQGDDRSTTGRWFVNGAGLPYALRIPQVVEYPAEKVDIARVFPHILEFAASGGTEARDFYVRDVNTSLVYRDKLGKTMATPVFFGGDHLPADTGCIAEWGLAVDFGVRRSQFIFGSAMTDDGSPVVAGYVAGAIEPFTNAGGLDAYAASYDAVTGREIWLRQFGGSGDDVARAVAQSPSGVWYVVGETTSPNFLGEPTHGGTDAFVVAIDPTGRIGWSHVFGGSGNDTGYAVAVGANNEIVIGGGSTSQDFDGAIYPGNTPSGFVIKLSASGDRLWAQQFITDPADPSSYSYVMGLDVDSYSGDVYMVGAERRYQRDASAEDNPFIARARADGQGLVWLQHIGDYGYRHSAGDLRNGYAFDTSVDDYDGSVYLTGSWFAGTAVSRWGDWSRISGDTSGDAWVMKLAPSGATLWSQTVASADRQNDWGQSVRAFGAGGSVYFSGRTQGALPRKTSAGGDDFFVSAYRYDGTPLWTTQGGTAEDDSGYVAAASVWTERTGSVVAIGNTAGRLSGDEASHWDVSISSLDAHTGSVVSTVYAQKITWRVGAWSSCSAACDIGTITRSVTCIAQDGSQLPDSSCAQPKPATSQACLIAKCSYNWVADSWSACSNTCGIGTQSGRVYCQRSDGAQVDDGFCDAALRPASPRNCSDLSGCTYDWRLGSWSTCSAACEGGTQTRSVTCQRSDGAPVNDTSCNTPVPARTQTCNTQACVLTYTDCARMRAAGVTASGWYDIDRDGSGPLPAQRAYCDMTSFGGGWTNFDFVSQRVYMSPTQFIQCTGGLAQNVAGVACRAPYFNNDRTRPLFLYSCDFSDRSAYYLLDWVAPNLGHAAAPTLGFPFLAGDGRGTPSTGDNEYCFVNGQIERWDSAACAIYRPGTRNGSCTPGVVMFNR